VTAEPSVRHPDRETGANPLGKAEGTAGYAAPSNTNHEALTSPQRGHCALRNTRLQQPQGSTPPQREGAALLSASSVRGYAGRGSPVIGGARGFRTSREDSDTRPPSARRLYRHKHAKIKIIDYSAESSTPMRGQTLDTIEIMTRAANMAGQRHRPERYRSCCLRLNPGVVP
jgi:hypothetical protein